jgi:hypothetical protein
MAIAILVLRFGCCTDFAVADGFCKLGRPGVAKHVQPVKQRCGAKVDHLVRIRH